MNILSIESSCDETAAAVTNGRKVLSNVIFTQVSEHRIYGGVVPEIASRRHTEAISTVCRKAIAQANLTHKDIDAVAVTFAPGLIGALLVGTNFAKGLSMSLNVPLIPVHHLRSHIAANYIDNEELKPPFLCLTVSGGNTLLTHFKQLGGTLDDAAGECFDKTARTLGLTYPGGVMLDKIASVSDFEKYPLPYPKTPYGEYNFSFSGLKTAVINLVHNTKQKNQDIDVPVLAASIRERVCDILIDKTISAAENLGYKTLAIAGGVSANSELRRRMSLECEKRNIRLFFPQLKYCGDNAAMVGVQGYYEYLSGNTCDETLNATATLPIDYR